MKVNLLESFIDICVKKKNDIAVEHCGRRVTFEELFNFSKKIAHAASDLIGNCNNKPVAVLLPKGIEVVAADLAAVISGNPFINLNISDPEDRIHKILQTVEPCLLITDRVFLYLVGDHSDIPVLDVETCQFLPKEEAERENWGRIIDTDPFCIINTSGSTGVPKSVVLNHRNFIDFMEWSFEKFEFSESDVVGSLSPVVFDIFVFELCLLMTKGARIHLIDSSLAGFPVRLVEELNRSCITFIFWVPTVMVNIANMGLLEDTDFKHLRLVWFAGEVFPTRQFLYWYDRLSNTRFVNMYGPIEITLDCVFYEVTQRPDESKPLPIGIPCRNTDVLLLNEKDMPAMIGESAELCVRGSSLAMGYYNNPERTAQAFVQNPLNHSYPELIYRTGDIAYRGENGLLYLKGRMDSMIKHNGYRIELAEIEHVIVSSTRLVANCCAVYDKANRKIALFYESEREIPRAEFRKMLSQTLPNYMIPDVYVSMKELPRNANGKIDRFELTNRVVGIIKK